MSDASKTTVRSGSYGPDMDLSLRPSVIELVVDDMATTLAFYRRLGLDLPPEADDAPHVEVELGGGVRLAFDTTATIRSFDPAWTAPAGGHRMALACACESPAAVDAAWAAMVEAGADGHLAPWDAPWGMRYAVLRDPDGTPVDLFAPLG